ncbi:MAG: hypothetical protein DWQ44_10065 [Bacteroidetes bacterium]|nr:MAG: hypothetical protein DWQ33_10340 [Bacteroidota bacterium]REK06624.1 MAG: hypothetical protein DWQ39_03855 [Bacteroidota bacterium]REK33390.1 MAG: hypothetical protein DWQ44_10065 [Bacteroidota bacterium]REK49789.1 MAG: hypothetical protein DWQ48_06620 [Bacteroidota bacterium]
MKKILSRILTLLILMLLTPFLQVHAQDKNPSDEMKKYYFVLLMKGPNRNQDSLAVQEIQKGHLDNISRLYEEGKIDLAGPFLADTAWRGIFVFNSNTEEEVRELLKSDPAISSGRLDYVILPWYSKRGAMLR